MLLTLLTLLSALAISAVAIFYSIAGLAAIFAGAAVPIMIMGTVLEVGKLVTASWLYQNWKKSPFFLKFYLTIAVVVLMFIRLIFLRQAMLHILFMLHSLILLNIQD